MVAQVVQLVAFEREMRESIIRFMMAVIVQVRPSISRTMPMTMTKILW